MYRVNVDAPYGEGTINIDPSQVAALRRGGHGLGGGAFIYLKGGQTIIAIDNRKVDAVEKQLGRAY